MDDFISDVLLLIVLPFAVFLVGYTTATNGHDVIDEAEQAIQQCEAELPKHQSCRVVISAEVKDEG